MQKSATLFSFKVDVDTFEGGKQGIPSLLRLFKKHGVPASFFGAMGPDHSGRAVFRVFTHKGFLKKMLRTKATRLYGLKTMLYGTLLPGPIMAEKLQDEYRMVISEGFELGLHGYDHIAWHNGLATWGEERIRSEYEKMFSLYRKVAGQDPLGFAAPGWQESAAHLKASDAMGIRFRSDTRFGQPCFLSAGGYRSQTLEVPTTFPSLDEVLGREDMVRGKELTDVMMGCLGPGKCNVFTLHTELEGRFYLHFLEEFILKLKQVKGLEFLTVGQMASRVQQQGRASEGTFRMDEVPGRAGLVAVAEQHLRVTGVSDKAGKR
jgi:undecaprenyl phosphate-alpha-L-ara4FN deformylase